MITRRAFIQTSAALAAAIPFIGMTDVVFAATDDVSETTLSDFARALKFCHQSHMNMAITEERHEPKWEIIHGQDITEHVSHLDGYIDHFLTRKIVRNSLDELGLTYRIIHTNMIDPTDLEIPMFKGVVQSNILDGYDAIILDDYSTAMPRVKNMLTHRMLDREDTLFIVMANQYGDGEKTLAKTNKFLWLEAEDI